MARQRIPYFKWRDGRPRWEPGPALRARGHKGRDLKDASGAWLSRGAAIDAAERLNDAIARNAAPPARQGARTMSALFKELKASPRFKEDGAGRRLAARTRKDYLRHLEILEAWCGDELVAALTPAAIEDFHEKACAARGLAMANAIMRTLKLALFFAMHKLRWIASNPCVGVALAETEGRTVMWSCEETETFLAAADWCGRHSIGDAHVLALTTAQNRADIIALPPLALNRDGVYELVRRKTGSQCFIPPTAMLEARLATMRKRKAETWPNVTFGHELIETETGKPYPLEGSRLSDEHRAVRALASGLVFALEDIGRFVFGMPPSLRNLPFAPRASIWDKRFQDLRDTAVTDMLDAGCDVARVATVTGHSLKTVQTILDKHYFVRHAGLAKDAGRLLDAHRKKA